MTINPTAPMPLYQQFKLMIERKIAAGEWPPGSPLPPELNLIKEYGISRTTARQALDELVNEGRIYRQRGRGTFVAAPKIAQTLAHLTGFAEELTLKGLALTVKVLTHQVVRAPDRVADALKIEPQTDVLHIRRLVSVDGGPLFVDDSYFPMALSGILGIEAVHTKPIYQLLEAAGRFPAEGEQWLEAVAIAEDLAGYLGVTPATPGLAITRVTKDLMGDPIEFTSVVYRGDRYRYAICLRRSQTSPSHFA